jgi:hypothetical protein
MSHYKIRQILVQVEYDDGKRVWFGSEFPDGCRTVTLGLDAYGTAGTYFPPPAERPGLVRVEEGVTLTEEGVITSSGHPTTHGGRKRPRTEPVEAEGDAATLDEPAMAYRSAATATDGDRAMGLAVEVTPDICEYRNGKWYCW